MLKKLGLKDVPIINKTDESLGLYDYSLALSEFIKSCETPLTISIQGDWGSGKTSIMNLIKENIDEQNSKGETRIKTIWFNTWQYSQFNLEEYLAISLISYFAKELGKQKGENVKKLLGAFITIAKAGVITAASLAGQGDSAKEGLSYLDPEKKIDTAMQIKELRDNLESIVEEIIGDGPDKFERVVVFIDDLDRLIPEKAVDFLEAFKLFLDIENCVFILACDYNVVMQGLQQKFGIGEKELKGKSFFDKIIQLPFTMPTGLGDRRGYIGELLGQIEAKYEPEDLEDYEELVDKSFGFNPRNMKRIFNSLLLLNLVAKQKKLFGKDKSDAISTEEEKQKILFAILCMQIAYEPVYSYLIRNVDKIDQQLFDSFINYKELLNDEENMIKQYPYLAELHLELDDDKDKTKMKKLAVFMKQFYNTLELSSSGDKDKLLPEEKELLVSILSFSSITSVQAHEALDESVSDKMKSYFDFFTDLRSDLQSAGLASKREVKPKNMYVFATGKNRAYYNFVFNRDDRCSVEVTLESDKEVNKRVFDNLFAKKEEIENSIGEEISWERLDEKRFSRIAVYRDGSINEEQDKLDELRKWAVEKAVKFYGAIDKHL